MKIAATFGELLLDEAERHTDAVIYRYFASNGENQRALTRGELGQTARALAGAMLTTLQSPSLAAAPPRALVCTGPGADQAISIFACMIAGVSAVPVYPPDPNNREAGLASIEAIARACGARVLVAGAGLVDDLEHALRGRMGNAAPKVLSVDACAPAAGVRGSPESDAVLLYTSGSTGAPKGVRITHAGLLANMRAMIQRCVPEAPGRICTWLPHAHIAGLYTRLLALVAGGEAAVLPPAAFVARPLTWLELVDRQRSRMSAAPDFAYNLCAQVVDDASAAKLDLSCWSMLVSGGERVRPATVARFFARFAAAGLRREALHPYYGMTETLCSAIPQQQRSATMLRVSKRGLAHARVRTPEQDDDVFELVSNGAPLGDDTEIITVDPSTHHACRAGRIGELWIRGPGVTPGYDGDSSIDGSGDESGYARLVDGRGPYLRTGDLGLIHDGEVYVTGRCKELLIVRGKNHDPIDVETTVARATGLAAGSIAAFTVVPNDEEALGLAIETERSATRADELVRAARRAVALSHGLAIARMFLLEPGALPLTATHKLARQRCRELAESGAWSAFAAASTRRLDARPRVVAPLARRSGAALRAAMLSSLLEILAEGEVGEVSVTCVDRPIVELGLSSLELARVATGLRRLLGIEPALASLFSGATVREFVEIHAQLLEGSRESTTAVAGWRDSMRRVAVSLPNLLPPRRSRDGAILLTGATGFLGSYLLASLLRQTSAQIRCLVRARDVAAGRARLIAALREGPGWSDDWDARVVVLPGDLLAPRLGLTAACWRALVDDVAQIVHNAANVNFVAPYATLREVNVDPVHAIVELACSGGACKTVHLVSTLAVFNATYRREQRLVRGIDRLLEPDYLYSGYAQTKWVAEACFRAAGTRGLPLGIHRPGLIVGSSTRGHTNIDDFMSRFILGCIALGRYPDAEVELDLVAVDDVADGIAAAVSGPIQAIDTFHWSNPRPVPIAALMQVYRERGYALGPQPLQRWLASIRTSLPRDNPLFPVHPFLLEIPPGADETILEFMDGLPLEIETLEADAAREAAGVAARPVDAALMHRMAAYFEHQGHLCPQNPAQPLHTSQA